MGRQLLVIALAGCDKILSLTPIAPPPPDASGFACGGLATKPWLCGDFDEATGEFFEDGAAVALPSAMGAVTAAAQMPGLRI